jgi:hypothetical protein
MATLFDLDKETLSKMSDEELQNLLHGIRRNRRTPVEKPKPKKGSRPKPAAEMTSADAANLLALLGVKTDE